MTTKYDTNLMDLFHDKKLVKICAPMVRYSKIQFRSLVRDFDCDLCFTSMMLADVFCENEKYRDREFSTNLGDTPLVVQFAANTVHDFVGAAHMVSPYCSGVNLNCCCPQRWANTQGLGCVMLENPELVSDLVRQCRNHIPKPFSVSVKMRLLPDIKRSIMLGQQLEHCGVSFLTVHGRYPSQIATGSVDINAIRLISESTSCPIIANGGATNLDAVIKLQEETKCKGVMVANSLLTNPALFTGVDITPLECVKRWLDICYNSTLQKGTVLSYNNVTERNIPKLQERNENLTFQRFHHHLVFMLEKILPKHSRKILNNLKSFQSVLDFLKDNFNIEPSVFSLEKFEKHERLHINYENRKDKYFDLKGNRDSKDVEFNLTYNTEEIEGQYFNAKKIVLDDSDSSII